ncbi:MAG: hypothetical protein WD873_00785, partial [Candidatus Hydrogenedentales bacterium]
QERLKIVDSSPPGDPSSSPIGKIAKQYVQVLRHVRYKSIGINFKSLVPHEDPSTFIIEQFIKDGAWKDSPQPLENVTVRFSYGLQPSRRLNLTISQARKAGDGHRFLLLDANFHCDCTQVPPIKEIQAEIDRARENWDLFIVQVERSLALTEAIQ